MIKHLILWQLKEELTVGEKKNIKADAKRELEGLVGKIEGLVSLTLTVEGLPSSNADMMLDALLTDEAALERYAKSPVHNGVADRYVRPYTAKRLCLDYVL